MFIIVDVGLTLSWRGPTVGSSTRFRFQLEPGVHVAGKETVFCLLEFPHFMGADHPVPHVDGFMDFRCAPRTRQAPFVVGVWAFDAFSMQQQMEALFGAGLAQRESQFAAKPVRQDGVKQPWRW